MAKKSPDPVDRHVGARIRMRRLMLKFLRRNSVMRLDLLSNKFRNMRRGPIALARADFNISQVSYKCRYLSFSKGHLSIGAKGRRFWTRLLPNMSLHFYLRPMVCISFAHLRG